MQGKATLGMSTYLNHGLPAARLFIKVPLSSRSEEGSWVFKETPTQRWEWARWAGGWSQQWKMHDGGSRRGVGCSTHQSHTCWGELSPGFRVGEELALPETLVTSLFDIDIQIPP